MNRNPNSAVATQIATVRKLMNEGKTPGMIAKDTGKSLKWIRAMIKIVKDIDKRNARIVKMRKKGLTIASIAISEEVSESTVRRVLKEAK